MKTLDEVSQIIGMARQQGCRSVEIDGVKYDVERSSENVPRRTQLTETELESMLKAMGLSWEDPSDEELKYYHTTHFDELQARKEAKRQRIEEEKLIKE